ncbi:hypothetical protein [Pseudomonas sp. P108]|uniref:hypothetical protein n=1 Tax=Pseudomonas sp. P108 TaxID=1837993 RepID=UPI0029350965|nr:hypothetical protein [Pseudomonas sp. P108]WNZ81610.1 hypothetical protein QOM10_14975 [Pseudomonas sp. P108]
MKGHAGRMESKRETRTSIWKLGLSLSALLMGTACSDRPIHLTPPNRADPILEVSGIKLESTDAIIKSLEDGGINKQKRNAAQFRLLAQSDIYCGDFISSIYGRRATTNVWYSTITTATAAAAAIVGGRAAQNLAGTSAVTNEMRGSINNEMYGGELVPTVAKEIISMRKAELAQIIQMQKQPVEDYGATAALADAISYHELCSIPIAVSSILARANTRSSESTVDLAGLLKVVDEAITHEKNRLSDKAIVPDAAETVRIKNRINDLSDRRSDLVRLYVIPGVNLQQAGGSQAPRAE